MAKGVYRRYRGTRPRKNMLVPVLVALCVLAAIVLIYINFNLEDGGDGTMVLSLPFTDETIVFGEPETKLIVEKPVDVVVEVEKERPKYEPFVESVCEIPLNEDFAENLNNVSDISTVAIYYKNEAGNVADNEVAKEAWDKIKEEGLQPIAIISCFRDDAYAKDNEELSCTDKDGNIWEDEDGYAWLNPYEEESVEHICKVIEEAYEAGFSDIMLTNAGFPVSDEVHFDGENEKEKAINDFLEKIKSLCDKRKDLKISIYFDDADNGQNIKAITDNVHRVYISNYDIYNEVETLIPEKNANKIIILEMIVAENAAENQSEE